MVDIQLKTLTFDDLVPGDEFIKLPEANNGHGGETFQGICTRYLRVRAYPFNVAVIPTGEMFALHPSAPVIKLE
jgi:hypothetical protein